MKPGIHEKLSHLSDEGISELIERYYADEKVSDLLEYYEIDVRPSDLVSLFPPVINYDKKCPYCNVNMWEDRKAKSSYLKDSTAYCPKCNHQDLSWCYCQNCNFKRKEDETREKQQKQNVISSTFQVSEETNIDVLGVNYIESVYLGALLRIGLEEDLSKIKPVNDFIEPLAPTVEYQAEILRYLRNAGLIDVDPDSPFEAFKIDYDSNQVAFDIFKVNYTLKVVSSDMTESEFINFLMNPRELDPENSDVAFQLWKRIALEECKEYFLYNLESVGFDYTIGEKTEAIFSDLLENFSTAQIYSIIWSCTSTATRYYQEKRIPRKQAANSVIGNCQRYAEKALTEGWTPRHYSRVKECPQSTISKFFFNRVLKIGDDGFNSVPRLLQ